MSDQLHYTLPSGRVLLLKDPLTPEELECAQQNPAIFELIADQIAGRAEREINSDSPAGRAMLRKHGLFFCSTCGSEVEKPGQCPDCMSRTQQETPPDE